MQILMQWGIFLSSGDGEKNKILQAPTSTAHTRIWVIVFANFHEAAHKQRRGEKLFSRVCVNFPIVCIIFSHFSRIPKSARAMFAWRSSCAWTWSWIKLSAFLHATGVCVGSIGLIGRWNPGNLHAIKLRHIKSHEPTFSHLERLSNA